MRLFIYIRTFICLLHFVYFLLFTSLCLLPFVYFPLFTSLCLLLFYILSYYCHYYGPYIYCYSHYILPFSTASNILKAVPLDVLDPVFDSPS